MSALYEIEGLRVDLRLPGDLLSLVRPGRAPTLNILDQIDLTIRPGETFGLVGESGSGKTTLARTMLGLTPASAGRLSFRGADLAAPGARADLRAASAMMFQDPVASLSPRMRVASLVTEPLMIHGRKPADRQAEARRLLAQAALELASLEAIAKPDAEQKKKINALKRDRKVLQERIDGLARLADQVGGVISEAEARALILRKHHDLVAEQLERYLGAEKRALLQVFEGLWVKYAVSLQDIDASRMRTAQQLDTYLTRLSYAP